MPDRARPWSGDPPPRHLTSCYDRLRQALRQPLEPGPAAAIRMMDRPCCRTAHGQGFAQSGESPIARQPVAGCPANHPACEQVDNDGEVQPAFAGPDTGDVGALNQEIVSVSADRALIIAVLRTDQREIRSGLGLAVS